MAHRAATDEICVAGGMGNAPSSKRRGLVRVSAWCLLAPKDLACPLFFAQNMLQYQLISYMFENGCNS